MKENWMLIVNFEVKAPFGLKFLFWFRYVMFCLCIHTYENIVFDLVMVFGTVGAKGGIRPLLCRRKEWSWAWHDSFQVSKRNLISYVFVDLVYSTGFRIRFVKGKYYVHWFVISFWFIYGKEGTFSMFCLIMLPTILPMVFTDPYLNTFSLLETGELGHFIAVWGSSWKICRLSTSLFINLWLDTRRRDIGASHYHTVCA